MKGALSSRDDSLRQRIHFIHTRMPQQAALALPLLKQTALAFPHISLHMVPGCGKQVA
jgi:hypothetical protein